MTSSDWKFEDPPNVAVLTTKDVVTGSKHILLVAHDEDDGSWQFHSGEEVNPDDAMVVALSKIVALDSSIEELADLPLGWVATRPRTTAPWVRAPATRD